MRNLKPPVLSTGALFDDCVGAVSNVGKRADLLAVREEYIKAESNYLRAATNHTLYQLPGSFEDNDAILFGAVSKSDLKGLYSSQMVPSKKPARKHYDKLLLSSPQRRCPFCGFGRVTTLDHFLNKSSYPWLAIVPINLIPACKDCNHGKGTGRATSSDSQTVHPYFEGNELSNDQWLFASVKGTTPVTIDYRAETPTNWNRALRLRVERHFIEFDLRSRFAVEAATELGPLRLMLTALRSDVGRSAVESHLGRIAVSEREYSKNSWKTALYQALSESDWYIDHGYLLE